jgi:glucose-6-phosphate 1-dehydrogenase
MGALASSPTVTASFWNSWAVVDPIVSAWEKDKTPPQQYVPGSWGPQKSLDLIERDVRRWLQSENPDQPDPVLACAL